MGGKVDTSNYFKNGWENKCIECNGRGYISQDIGVVCNAEDAMWFDEENPMRLGSESWDCGECNGEGYVKTKHNKNK